jgi:hypothetical protein
MNRVFINYRRGETAGEARALFKDLTAALGKDSVFMDVDNIALGRDFREVLRERLEACDIMLALIGKDWIDSANASGTRRLDEPNDFVRLEIETALKRNIPVTPVLVQGAKMPNAEQLPESLRDFAFRNGFELSHNRWESDVHEMLKRLGLGKQREDGAPLEADAMPQRTPAQGSETATLHRSSGSAAVAPRRTNTLGLVGVGAVVVALGIGGVLYYRTHSDQKTEQSRQDTAGAKADAEARSAQAKLDAAKEAAAQAERAAAAQAEKDRAVVRAAEEKRTKAEGDGAAKGKQDAASTEMCGLVRCGGPAKLIER